MSRGGGDAARARRLRWTVAAGGYLLGALARTWRIRVRGGEHLRALRDAGQSIIFVCPHGQMLPLLWQHRGEGVAVLISEHRDGEIIARVASNLGFRTVRGSTSRGASRALLGLIHVLEQGLDVAITPDGPRGPLGSFAPGPLVASQRTGRAILMVAASASRAWRLGSWDRFLIPRPFARVTVAYGEPVVISDASARAAAARVEEFQRRMRETIELADG